MVNTTPLNSILTLNLNRSVTRINTMICRTPRERENGTKMSSRTLMMTPTPDSATPKVRIFDGFRLEWVLDTGMSNTTGAVILRNL